VVRNFLANVWSTFVGFVNSSKRKLIGRLTRREDVNSTNEDDNAVMPDMEISKAMRAAIQTAAMRAKLLFDTYKWTWSDNNAPPTVKEIVETYLDMVNDVWEESMRVEDGETVGNGSVMKGRLTCEYVDEQWTFGIELTTTIDGDDVDSDSEEKEDEEGGVPKKKLANFRQLDA
jgi:hypothetical protein